MAVSIMMRVGSDPPRRERDRTSTWRIRTWRPRYSTRGHTTDDNTRHAMCWQLSDSRECEDRRTSQRRDARTSTPWPRATWPAHVNLIRSTRQQCGSYTPPLWYPMKRFSIHPFRAPHGRATRPSHRARSKTLSFDRRRSLPPRGCHRTVDMSKLMAVLVAFQASEPCLLDPLAV